MAKIFHVRVTQIAILSYSLALSQGLQATNLKSNETCWWLGARKEAENEIQVASLKKYFPSPKAGAAETVLYCIYMLCVWF